MKEIKEKIKTPSQRWEDGDEHNDLSYEIFRFIKTIDFDYSTDYFCWKSGGDGDNGEELMYLLDIFFDTKQGKKFNQSPH